jgi:hypothetical protein
VTTHTARPIRFSIDGIHVGSGRVWIGIQIDVSARWSKNPKVAAAVTSRIERAIGKGHGAICYVNDSGERVAVSWEIEQ